jgi:two-component system nitrogen regulation response regulator NtrX
MAAEILVVDDEADIRMLIGGILTDEGYEARDAADSAAALEAIARRRPNLVILDIWLQGSEHDGLQLLEIIRRDHPTLPVVMISGHGNYETTFAAVKLGANDYIEKPFKADHLLMRVRKVLDEARLKRENEEMRMRLGSEAQLLGTSPAIGSVRQALERVAPTSSRVLITGPAGSGKEVVARLLHQKSRRADGPFVVLNCAIMRPERVEIELFGTEAGAEGPGSPAMIGTFEQAHGGTLLLDEVSDLPLETQGKMVRVLQEQTFERVGGKARVSVDVRVIASTNRDLQVEMGEGRFRQDLFYRLSWRRAARTCQFWPVTSSTERSSRKAFRGARSRTTPSPC